MTQLPPASQDNLLTFTSFADALRVNERLTPHRTQAVHISGARLRSATIMELTNRPLEVAQAIATNYWSQTPDDTARVTAVAAADQVAQGTLTAKAATLWPEAVFGIMAEINATDQVLNAGVLTFSGTNFHGEAWSNTIRFDPPTAVMRNRRVRIYVIPAFPLNGGYVYSPLMVRNDLDGAGANFNAVNVSYGGTSTAAPISLATGAGITIALLKRGTPEIDPLVRSFGTKWARAFSLAARAKK